MTTHDSPRPAGQPCWFDLSTPDLKTATAFYSKLFGWSYTDSGADFGHYHMAQVSGRSAAGIGPQQPDSQMPSVWTVYVAADNTDAMVEKAKSLGAKVLAEPFEVPGQGRMAFVQDPTGAAFGVWQPLQHIGAGISGTHGAMAWQEVNTPDAEAAKAFYTELLGATAEPLENSPSPYYVLEQGEQQIAGILQMTEAWQGVPPHWMPYFQVDDADAAANAAREAGGTVSVEPFDTPHGRIAILDDPFGAVFSVVQPPAAS